MAAKRDSKTQPEWAVEIWGVLIQQAKERQEKISYSEVGAAIGYGSARIGAILDYIVQYCKLRGLPKLTVLVVEKKTKSQGPALTPYTEVDYREVYNYDWQNEPIPTAEQFEEAMRLSKGDETERKFSKIRGQIAPFPSS
jgi:hypothetical protein